MDVPKSPLVALLAKRGFQEERADKIGELDQTLEVGRRTESVQRPESVQSTHVPLTLV